MSKKILIVEFDLFGSVGGGQTVYQNIVRKRPDDQFYYFTRTNDPELQRLSNATPIPFRRHYGRRANEVPKYQRHFFDVYCEPLDMALSVYNALGEINFDVVDTPDYRLSGLFLRKAFAMHGIEVGHVALALHGTLSSSFRFGWPWTDQPGRMFAALRMKEHLQFRVADSRYAISQFYADKSARYGRLPVNILDPLAAIRTPELMISEPENRAPDVAFIGRRERRKGPDLFVDLAWWLPRESYRRLMLLGADGLNHQDSGSNEIIDAMARRRGLSIDTMAPVSQPELRKLSHRKTVICLPSRYDQFNLVALETLLDGCPTVIGRQAGVANYIEQKLPELSWLLVDLSCDRSAARVMEKILNDYDGSRRRIVEALQRIRLTPDLESIKRIYDPSPAIDAQARHLVSDLADRFALFLIKGSIKPTARPRSPLLRLIQRINRVLITLADSRGAAVIDALWRKLRAGGPSLLRRLKELAQVWSWPEAMFRRILQIALVGRKSATELYRLSRTRRVRRNIVSEDERSRSDRSRKLHYLANIISDQQTDRVRFFREMIRLEHLRGNDLIAATYGLRIMRWLGGDHFQLLPLIKNTLAQHGYTREAEAAEAMYGNPADAEIASRLFLDDQWRRHQKKRTLPFEILDDRRSNTGARVSVVVSLYKAADKFPTFLRMLRQQTMFQSGGLEVVFVDSGSPTDEYRQFRAACEDSPLHAVFARSKSRETIQAAWNRGIQLARGDYVAFLGVDEGIRPDCLQTLVAELDQDPTIDWVIGNSIVTAVDRKGVFDRDVMVYDRTGYRQDWSYLDTTFLSYVGGLYRRDIHDRFGYYDETFRAAGDTEFKNRILPHIKSKHVPKLLGVFNNYPDGQTTLSPTAEIEDLRAWYLHRTVAGVSYAFDRRPVQDVVDLLGDTLGYRKCYTRHTSTDVDLAASLAVHLSRRPDAGAWKKAHVAMTKLVDTYRRLELLPNRNSAFLNQSILLRESLKIRGLRKKYRRRFSTDRASPVGVFNDNRYEQHWWSWSG